MNSEFKISQRGILNEEDTVLERIARIDLWTVVLNEHKTKKDGQSQWTTELHFYVGDLRNKDINWETDWRFCEVKGERKQGKMIGVYEGIFPIKYPLRLTNGITIEKIGLNYYF
jgi:hypothetical protein